MYDVRIHGLGQIPQTFPVAETVGAVASTGLLVGGLVVKKTPGTVMAVVGGVGLLTSGVLLIAKMASGRPAAPPPPPPPPSPPPPAPKPPSSSYSKYAEYAKAFAPVVNQLFSWVGNQLFSSSSMKGNVRQPALMVVR